MTDLPALPHRPGMPTTAAEIQAITDEQAEDWWAWCLTTGSNVRDLIGMLLWRELRNHGEQALGRKAREAAEIFGVDKVTVAAWRRKAEARWQLPPASARSSAHQQPPSVRAPTREVEEADLSAPITPDEVTHAPPPRPVHGVDRRAAASVHVELTEDELAVLDAWAAYLGMRADEVFVRMLSRVPPPTIVSPEAAVLRRAFKKLTEVE